MSYSESHQNISNNLQAIAGEQSQLIQQLKMVRDTQSYLQQGYLSFEAYCDAELASWGGYVRVQSLLMSGGDAP